MFGIGGTELIIILLFVFIVVGPDRLPEIAKTLGKAIAKFRETQDEMNEVIKKEADSIKREAAKAQHMKEVEERKARAAAEAASGGEEGLVDERPRTRVVRKDEVAASGAASEGASGAGEPASEEPKKPMSFSERKAAYERQRAERAAAEAAAAAEKEGE